jgi:PAS domain S-box-containing protein
MMGEQDTSKVKSKSYLEKELRTYKEKIKELEREKKTLESLIHHSFLGIVTVDEALRITSCNREFEKLFQYKESEILGKNLDEVIASDVSREEARKYSGKTLAGKATHGTGIRFRKDGSPTPVEFFAVPAIVDGKVVGAYGMYQDISERDRLERALKESEERYRKLVDMSPLAVSVYDFDGKVLFANKAALKLVGAESFEDLLDKNVFDFAHPDSEEFVRMRAKNLSEGKAQPKVEEKIQTFDGRILYIEAISTPIEYKGRQAILSVFQDITERIHTRELIRKSEARLKRVFQTSPLGIGMVSGRVMQWHNEAMSKLLGFEPEELTGKEARIIYPNDEEYIKTGESIASLGQGKDVTEVDTKWVRKDGDVFDCHLWYSLLDSEKDPPMVLAIAEDISKRKKMERLLKESEERYRQLVEFSPLPICVFDLDKIYFFNPAAIGMIDAKAQEDLANNSILDFIDPEYRDLAKGRLERILKDQVRLPPIVFKSVSLKGKKRYFESHSIPIHYNEKPAALTIFLDVTDKKKAEERLRKEQEKYQMLYEESKRQEELYRSLLNSSADAIVIYNLQGEVEYISPSFTKIFGWTFKELKGKRVPFVPDTEKGPSMAVIENLLRSETQVHGFETRRFTKDGKVLNISISASRFNDGGGNPAGLLVVLRDITKGKQAEKKLKDGEKRFRKLYEESKRQEELYRSLLNSSADAIVVYNLQGEAEFVSPSFTKIFGWCFDEIKGKKIPFVPESERAATEDIIKKLFTTKFPVHGFETRRFTKDGRVLDVSVSGSIYMDAKNKPVGMLVVLRDITERTKAEKAIRESERRFRELFNSVSDLIFTQDLEGRFLSVNRAIVDLFGYTPEEIIGRKGSDFMKPELRPYYQSEYLTAVGEKGYHKGIAAYFTKSGRKVYLENSSTLSKWENGELYISGIARDVTGWIDSQRRIKKLQEEMLQVQKMEAIGTLAGGIAHDFNNLLMGIQGNVSLLKLHTKMGTSDYERLKNIEDYIHSGSDLTMQLLGFARGGRYEVVLTNMNELIRKEVNLFGRTKKEVEIHLKLQEDLWVIKADQGQMSQVFLNLFVNAWQAMPKGGQIYVQTENTIIDRKPEVLSTLKPGKYVKITVSDTGTGMDEETRKRIFEPFFTTKGGDRGIGLGLASVYGIIENHGGTIQVESQIGLGTTFTLYFPATGEVVQKEKAKVKEEIITGMGRILLVDDEEKILDVGKQLLEVLGYEVASASRGEDAIEVFKRDREGFDLVVLDMIMPGMGGGEVFTALRKIDPNVKVLLASGYSIDGQASEIMAKGCNGFIQKPFTMEKISEKIKEILSN